MTQEFNVDQTVMAIHQFVMSIAPVDGSYSLMTGFPPKPLDDASKTILQAGLKGA